jgi:hypothetical protein
VVVEPDTGLITATRLTAAAGTANSDAAVGLALLSGDNSIAGPVQVLGDSAYGTGGALAALAATGHTPVIKPWPLRPVVAGGFTLDDFVVDEAAGTATCPHGVTRPITRTRHVVFGAACRGCPLRARCTTAGRGRALRLHAHDALQRAHSRRRPGLSGRLPQAPADGRAQHRLDHPPPPPSALPRSGQERRLAAPAHSRDQPPPPPDPRTHRHRRALGAELLTGTAHRATVDAGRATSLSHPRVLTYTAAKTAARRPAPFFSGLLVPRQATFARLMV